MCLSPSMKSHLVSSWTNLNKPHNQNLSVLRLYWLARRKSTFLGVRGWEGVTAFNPRLSKNPIKQCESSAASWPEWSGSSAFSWRKIIICKETHQLTFSLSLVCLLGFICDDLLSVFKEIVNLGASFHSIQPPGYTKQSEVERSRHMNNSAVSDFTAQASRNTQYFQLQALWCIYEDSYKNKTKCPASFKNGSWLYSMSELASNANFLNPKS